MKKTSSKSKATINKFLLIPEFKGNIRDLKISDAKYYYILGKDDTLYYVDVGSKICSNLCKINDVANLKESLNLGSKESKVLENEELGLIKELMIGMEVLAVIPKPDVQYIWGAGGSLIDPGAVKIDLGWLSAEKPPFQFFNFWQNKVDNYIAHNNQFGINQWDTITEYRAGSIVLASDNIHYVSDSTNINSNPTTNPTVWSRAFISEEMQRQEAKSYNYIINGGMGIWQRGLSKTFSGNQSGFTADRWLFSQSSGETLLARVPITTDTMYPTVEDIEFTALIDRTVGGSTTTFSHKVAGVYNIHGRKACLNFTFSYNSFDPATFVTIDLVQNFGTGGAPSAPVITQLLVKNLSNIPNWIGQDLLFDVPSIAGKVLGTNLDSYMEIRFTFSDNLFSAQVGGFGIFASVTKTKFYNIDKDKELSSCQRYFQKSYPIDVPPGSVITFEGVTEALTTINNVINLTNLTTRFNTTMQRTPSIVFYSDKTGAANAIYNNSTLADVTVVPGVANTLSASQTGGPESNAPVGNSDLLSMHWTAEAEL